jgi:hypothetical protein
MFGGVPDLAIGAFFNLAVAVAIVRLIYYPTTQDRKYIPSFLAFNTIVYFVLGFLSSVELSVGVGFGLFAIFSVLNYRTDEMPIREMTYLFALIALPVINSFLMTDGNAAEVVLANAFVVALLLVLERGWGFHYQASKKVTYDTINLITPANREQLVADLRRRTGLPVNRVEVGRINFLRDTAQVRIFYDEPAARESGWLDGNGASDRVLSRLADDEDL